MERIICEALLYESTMRCTPHSLTKLCVRALGPKVVQHVVPL